MVHIMYVDNLSHPSNSKLMVGSGIAMQVAGYYGNDVQCNYCNSVRRLLQDCIILKAK